MTAQQLKCLAKHLPDQLREDVHWDLMPYEPDEFVRECLKRDRVATLEAAILAGVVPALEALDR